MKDYILSIGPRFQDTLQSLTATLGIPPGDVVYRAITLLKHAADADQVKLIKGGVEQNVIVK